MQHTSLYLIPSAKPTEDNASKSNQNQDDSAQYHNHRHHYDENNLTNHRPVTKYNKNNFHTGHRL